MVLKCEATFQMLHAGKQNWAVIISIGHKGAQAARWNLPGWPGYIQDRNSGVPQHEKEKKN